MKDLEKIEKILMKEFGKLRKMYIATSSGNKPKTRIVNIFYNDKCFYTVTDKHSDLMKEVEHNSKVSFCSTASFHKFACTTASLGSPIDKGNEEISQDVIRIMGDWYHERFDENEQDTRILKFQIDNGFTYKGKIGYKVDLKICVINTVSL